MKKQGALGGLQHDIQHRGVSAWMLSALLIGFYVILYFGYDVNEPSGWFESFQNVVYDTFTRHLEAFGSAYLSINADAPDGEPKYIGNRWTVYGLLYTLAILGGGAYMLSKYRHNRYQVVRTAIVMFVQVSFAFSIPILLKFFGNPEFYFSYLWPLKIDYLDPKNFEYYGELLVLYGFFGSLVLVPIMTLLYGKRWYCSWVCGCGGLANTFGEPWRHLSTKSALSWKIEKITIHAVLIIAVVSTALWFAATMFPADSTVAKLADGTRKYYGWIVVAALSGAIGTGLYPIGGTRVWCRFFCPMAAILGLIQKLGRYRIKVKRDMCISCGMCSTYCEMGIDVRAYAQANQSFTRASCVGCGLCAEVCPRGVLRLENAVRRDPQELTWSSLIDESWKGDQTTIGARH